MSLVGFAITNHPQQVGKRGASDTVDERITPAKVFDPLHAEFDFTLDAAANPANCRVPRFHSLVGAQFPMDLAPGGNPFVNAMEREGLVRVRHNATIAA